MMEIVWRPPRSNGYTKGGFCTLLLECLSTVGSNSDYTCYEGRTMSEHNMGPTFLTLTVPRGPEFDKSREIVEEFFRKLVLEAHQKCARRALPQLCTHFGEELRGTEFDCLPFVTSCSTHLKGNHFILFGKFFFYFFMFFGPSWRSLFV
jgi:hypothetical protein